MHDVCWPAGGMFYKKSMEWNMIIAGYTCMSVDVLAYLVGLSCYFLPSSLRLFHLFHTLVTLPLTLNIYMNNFHLSN